MAAVAATFDIYIFCCSLIFTGLAGLASPEPPPPSSAAQPAPSKYSNFLLRPAEGGAPTTHPQRRGSTHCVVDAHCLAAVKRPRRRRGGARRGRRGPHSIPLRASSVQFPIRLHQAALTRAEQAWHAMQRSDACCVVVTHGRQGHPTHTRART